MISKHALALLVLAASPLHATGATPMSTSVPAGFTLHVIAPEGRAFLTSRVLLHSDFQVMPLPAEEIDFENPDRMMPLLIATTVYGPLVLSVAARPAYGDGVVSQWLDYMCRKEGYEMGPIQPTRVGSYPAVFCDARQVGDGITMIMRMVLLEDGGRMVNLCAMAPEPLWAGVEPRLQAMLESFEFAEDKGATAALFHGEAQENQVAATDPAPAANEMQTAAAEAAQGADAEASAPAPTVFLTAEEFAALVLAEDASSLDPEDRINANLRDRGVGLVPSILGVNPAERSVHLGAGSIESVIRVPMGWHVIDDGRRTLVFDADGNVQVNLDQRPVAGEPLGDVARSYFADYLREQPELEVAEMVADGVHAVAVRGVVIDGETLDQAFMVRDIGRPGSVIVARATGTAEHSVRAMNLAGDILARLESVEAVAARR